MLNKPSKEIETFVNPNIKRDYLINIEISEFTCLCPKTGQPDFAVLNIEYIANEKCLELKSLKNYMWSFRDEGCFHEDVTNRILDDLVLTINPRFIQIEANFNVRGGIYTTITAEHTSDSWEPK